MLTINDVTSLSSRLACVPMLRNLFVFMAGVAMLVLLVVPQARGDQALVLRVQNDFSTFDFQAGAGPGGPFYIRSPICEDTELGGSCVDPIGVFHCWGWLPLGPGGAPGLVSQEFELFGRGKIQTQGREDGGPRAVVGGTGEFKNVRGEATGIDVTNFPAEFIATFKLIGGKK